MTQDGACCRFGGVLRRSAMAAIWMFLLVCIGFMLGYEAAAINRRKQGGP